jgi:hypothetical protein
VHRAHRVLDRDPLRPGGLDIALGAAERRQDQRRPAGHEVRPVELRGDLHGQAGVAERGRGDVRVRRRLREVAAEADEDVRLAVAQRADGVDRVVPVLARRVEAELALERVEERLGRPLPDPHRAVALHVRVPTDREQPAPGLPTLPCANATLTISLIVATALWCWVRPIAQQKTVRSESRSSSASRVICSRLRPGGRGDDVPVDGAHVVAPRLEPGRVRRDEVVVERVPLDEQRAERLEQREVAVDPDRQVQVGQVGAVADDAARLLRVLEPEETRLPQRVHRDDRRAVPLGDLERRQHPRVVGAGFWPAMTMSFAVCRSSSVTLALPIPIDSASATLVDSWHMFEQSGRLFVPKARTNSW